MCPPSQTHTESTKKKIRERGCSAKCHRKISHAAKKKTGKQDKNTVKENVFCSVDQEKHVIKIYNIVKLSKRSKTFSLYDAVLYLVLTLLCLT